MPVPGDGLRFEYRSLAFDLHQDDDGSRHRDRRCSMHHNAQRTMVGIGVYLMHVRHLRHGKQSEQDETHHGDQRQSTTLCAAFPVPQCLQSCQLTCPCFKDTH